MLARSLLPERVDPAELNDYLSLADGKWNDRIASVHRTTYNQSLVAALIEHHGAENVEDWPKVWSITLFVNRSAVTVTNKGVAFGVCDIAVANTYYFGHMPTLTTPRKPPQKR